MFLDAFKNKVSNNKFTINIGVFEIDSTFLFFFIGLILGLIIFHNSKSLFVFLLFVCFIVFILIHDLPQILLAKKYSLKMRKYILFPFGTKKFYGKDFESPKHEFIYAFVGLATYFLLIILFVLLGKYVFPQYWPTLIVLKNTITAQTLDFALVQYPLFFAFWISFMLFVFNLFIWAMPMDGGRLFKVILTIIFGEHSANRIIPIVSRVIALLVICFGLFYRDILIILIGLFIYYFTAKEQREYDILRILEGKSVKTFMTQPDLIFDSEKNIMDCFKEMKEKMIPDALIKFEDNKYGIVDVEMISNISKDSWVNKSIGSICKIVNPVSLKENLAFIAQYMVSKDLEILPIIDNKQLLGILKRSDFADYIKIHKVL